MEISVPEPLENLCDYPAPSQEQLTDRTFWNNIQLHGLPGTSTFPCSPLLSYQALFHQERIILPLHL